MYSYVMAALAGTIALAFLVYMYYGPDWHKNDDMAAGIQTKINENKGLLAKEQEDYEACN